MCLETAGWVSNTVDPDQKPFYGVWSWCKLLAHASNISLLRTTVPLKPERFNQSINPFLSSGFSNLNFFNRSISSRGGVWVVKIITMFCKNSCIQYKQCIPDQPSDQGIHCQCLFYWTLGKNGLRTTVLLQIERFNSPNRYKFLCIYATDDSWFPLYIVCIYARVLQPIFVFGCSSSGQLPNRCRSKSSTIPAGTWRL